MSAYRSILVHLDTSPQALQRLQLAHQLAERHDGQVTALYASAPLDLIDPMGLAVGTALLPERLETEASRRDRVRALFDDAVASGMPRLHWAMLDWAEPLLAFSQHALYADLVILGQHQRDAKRLTDVPSDFAVAVMVESGRPVLLVPYVGAPDGPARRVLVAWKPTRESARALAAAMPQLQAAERVDVAFWSEGGAAHEQAPPAIDAYLRCHGVKATLHRQGEATRDLGERLLSLAADLDSELLVMGGYGHTRAREWVLGGVTRTVLDSMTLPVLMAH